MNKIFYIFLIGLILLGGGYCEQQEEQKSEKTKHFIFRTDPIGFQAIVDKFSHIFMIFYNGDDIDSKVEEYMDNFARNEYNEQMLFVALEQKQSEEIFKQMEIIPKYDHEVVLLRNGVPFQFEHDIKQNLELFSKWGKDQLVSKLLQLESEEDVKVLLNTYEENSAVLYLRKGDEDSLNLLKEYLRLDIFLQNYIKNVYYHEFEEQSKNSTLMVLKVSEFDEEKKFVYSESLKDQSGLIDFLRISTLKAITILKDETYLSIFGSPIGTQVLMFEGEDQSKNQQMGDIFEKSALYNINEQMSYQRGIFTIVQNDDKRKDLYKLFMVDASKGPQIIVTRTEQSSMGLDKYRYSQYYESLVQDNLIQFIEDVQLKKVEAYYQSEEVPKQYGQKDRIRKIVGNNFMEEVIRQKTSYLILFWDSKDKFSAVEKEKLLKELIDKYQHKFNDILKIGKFDLNLNEHELVRLDKAPQLVIYPKQDKRNPVEFSLAVQSLDNLKIFLRQWVQDIDFEETQQLGQAKEQQEKIDL